MRIPFFAKALGKEPLVTYGLAGFLAALYLCEICLPIDGIRRASPTAATMIALGALNKAVIWETDEWYRLATAPFLNGSGVAIIFNIAMLAVIGPAFEKYFGRAWFAAFVLIAAGVGAALSFSINEPETTTVGSAGLLSGLFTALYFYSYRLPAEEKERVQLRVLGAFAIFLWPILNGIRLNMHIFNYGGHIGGILTGIIFGALAYKKWPAGDVIPWRRTALVIFTIGGAVLGASFTIVAMRYPFYVRTLG